MSTCHSLNKLRDNILFKFDVSFTTFAYFTQTRKQVASRDLKNGKKKI